MIKRDEEIISSLEELDYTFSQINKVLRQLKCKVEALEDKNKGLIDDFSPWCKFFSIEKPEDASPAVDMPASDIQTSVDTQSFLRHSSPTNPFYKKDKGSLGVEEYHSSEPSTTFVHESTEIHDSVISDLVEFSQDLLPDGFKEIDEIKMIYQFIEKRRSVSVEDVYEHFNDVSSELMGILLDVLVRKNFIRSSGNKLNV